MKMAYKITFAALSRGRNPECISGNLKD